MAKKRDRGFFVCPRWHEIADTARQETSGVTFPMFINQKTLIAIESGRPLARSTLRKALLASRQVTGSMFDVDHYIVDQRIAARQG